MKEVNRVKNPVRSRNVLVSYEEYVALRASLKIHKHLIKALDEWLMGMNSGMSDHENLPLVKTLNKTITASHKALQYYEESVK